MDQRKVNVLAREYCDVIKRRNKPIILSHRKYSPDFLSANVYLCSLSKWFWRDFQTCYLVCNKGKRRCQKVTHYHPFTWKMRRYVANKAIKFVIITKKIYICILWKLRRFSRILVWGNEIVILCKHVVICSFLVDIFCNFSFEIFSDRSNFVFGFHRLKWIWK